MLQGLEWDSIHHIALPPHRSAPMFLPDHGLSLSTADTDVTVSSSAREFP